MWSLANGQQSILKALSNSDFLLIPLDGKKKGDKHSHGRAKVGKAFSKDTFLIIPLHWLSFCLPRTGVSVCKKDYIRKGGGYASREADNLGIGTDTPDSDNTNEGANNPSIGTNIPDTNNMDRETDNSGTGTVTPNTDNTDGGVNNSSRGIDTLNANKDRGVDDLGIRTTDADRQVAASNKARASFFFLHKALFWFLLLNQRSFPLLRHFHFFPHHFWWSRWIKKPLFSGI